MINSPSNLLSGGWRMRISLAKILFCEPDILLLDEPTNHLDLDAVLWLEDYLKNFKNTILVVSHCKSFLKTVCTDIIDFHNKNLYSFNGGFEEFERYKYLSYIQNKKNIENQNKQIKTLTDFINKNKYNSNKSGLVKSRMKYLKRIEVIENLVRDDPNYNFEFIQPKKINSTILRIDDGYFSYNKDKIFLKNLNLILNMDSRIALLGSNGVGKTTFINILTKKLKLQKGNFYSNPRAKISLFSQHNKDKLNLLLSPFEEIKNLNEKQNINKNLTSKEIFSHLSRFGIQNDLALRPIYLLSGGQKSRVSFSLSTFGNPNFLILDEPTNHLDIDSTDALIYALNNYKGGLVVISHDQYFISNVCKDIWYIKNGFLKKYYKDFENYKFDFFNDML